MVGIPAAGFRSKHPRPPTYFRFDAWHTAGFAPASSAGRAAGIAAATGAGRGIGAATIERLANFAVVRGARPRYP